MVAKSYQPEKPDLGRDLRTLANFITVYCHHRHAGVMKAPVDLKTHDVEQIAGRPVRICDDCAKLLAHAFTKRTHCPLSPKPACKNCPSHCYHPTYRRQIQEAMRVAGKKMVLTGRLDYLFHLLF